ncbi:helicase-exonuclease AddAB subunit AddB [Macrococcus carouselicus]|uniref:Helicase-exonuclease AddAB subunit AddB n=1 Tax=Macrococcus carouselicus TaxID=69969 RepID=A0A9Q8CJI7_9STAP|nr:helicase-exonuclease AddAB subunit AddB [Macrococcus carouselicus]TDM03775.1 helicase-exonuclease AddAB subunit AddB [Macrococcus carouselicus]
MSVKLLLGRRGSGKTYHIMTSIKEEIRALPLGDPIIVITPKQSTFTFEQQLARDPEIKGSLRASIYGFDRLAWRIMSEEGGLSEEMISGSGIEMLVHMILKEQQDNLQLFRSSARYYGFSQKVTEAIKDFKKYGVDAETLQILSADGTLPVRTQHKLHDIALIYDLLEKSLAGHYTQSEDILHFLYDRIPHAASIRHADIYIDGFHNFTTLEYQVIQQLARHAKSMTMTLTVDLTETNETFRKTRETYDLLMETLNGAGVEVSVQQLADSARFRNSSLALIERQFDALLPGTGEAAGVTVSEAESMRKEVEHVVRTIHRQARLNQYRYVDTAVLYRDDSYISLFKEYFAKYHVPYYTDSKEQMIHHPAVELIRSLLDFISQPWQTEHLFRALKTGLLSRRFDMQHDQLLIDMLENTVIERGLSFNRWLEDSRFFYDKRKPYGEEEWLRMNQFRTYITPVLTELINIQDVTTAREFAMTLYEFLTAMKIPDYLMAEKDRLVKQGLNHEALKNEQVYMGIINLLDELVEMMENQVTDFQTMKEMLDVGLSTLEFSGIPQALDEVQLLNMDLARIENIPCVFVVGFNEDVLPRANKDNALISDQDKAMVENVSDVRLAPSSIALTMDESFVAYQVLTNASEELHITYSLMDEGGNGRQPSSYLNQLQAIFPDLTVQRLSEQNSPEALIETIAVGVSHAVEQQDAPEWQYVIDWLSQFAVFRDIMSLKDYRNETVQLNDSRSQKIYGHEIKASVSRFETYNNCPFKHFAEHGLKLNIRQPFEFQHFELGNIFHHALKIISEEIKDSIVTMNKKDIERYVKVTLERLVPDVQYQVLFSTAYYQYMIERISNILTETLAVIQTQQSRSAFRMARFEQNFTADPVNNHQFEAARIYTKQGIPISIRGQIDRIDLLQGTDKDYVSIIDYKSSEHDLKLSEVYYGKQMQMLTYMDVVLQNADKLSARPLDPAAMLYFHVQQPFLRYGTREETLEHDQAYFEAYRLKGFVLDDLEIARKLDTGLEAGTKSGVIPVNLTAKGVFDSRSRRLTKREIEGLIDINRSNYINTASAIMDGGTKVAPLEFNKQLPCTFCAFSSTCHIDPVINAGDIRRVDEKIDVKALLKEETDED